MIRTFSLSSLRKDYGSYSSTGEINFRVGNPTDVIERISGIFSDYEHDYLDGLTVNADKWWFNLRPSNTEPLLRLNLRSRYCSHNGNSIYEDSCILNSSLNLRPKPINEVRFFYGFRPKALEVLACPEDKGPLWYFEDEEILYNPRLRRVFAIDNGIPVLLIDESKQVL